MVPVEGTKKDISHMFVLQAVDYYICSKELADQDIELHVAERFDSKHLPVELSLCSKEDQPNSKKQLFVEEKKWYGTMITSLHLLKQLGVRCSKMSLRKLRTC